MGWALVELGHAVRALDALPDPAARRLLLALADPRRHGPRPYLRSNEDRMTGGTRAGALLAVRW